MSFLSPYNHTLLPWDAQLTSGWCVELKKVHGSLTTNSFLSRQKGHATSILTSMEHQKDGHVNSLVCETKLADMDA